MSVPLSRRFPGNPLFSSIDTPRFAVAPAATDDIISEPHSSLALFARSVLNLVSHIINISAEPLILWNRVLRFAAFPRPFTFRDFTTKLEALLGLDSSSLVWLVASELSSQTFDLLVVSDTFFLLTFEYCI